MALLLCDGAFALSSSVISGNGGGIQGTEPGTISNCTITGNTVSGIVNDGPLTVSDCTIFGNTGYQGGGIDDLTFGTVTLTLENTIVAGNTNTANAFGAQDPDINAVVTANKALQPHRQRHRPVRDHQRQQRQPDCAIKPSPCAPTSGRWPTTADRRRPWR